MSCLDIGIGWNDSSCLDPRWPEFLGTGSARADPLYKRKFSQKDWDRYFGLMEWSGCHWLRHSISISDWKPLKDDSDPIDGMGFVFDSEEMRRHYTVLDQAEKRGIKVLLANWDLGARQLTKRRKARKKNRINHHPENEDAFAEALAMLVYHLKRVKKYQCVWALSLWNEPNDTLAYTGPNANYPDSFWPLYRLVDNHLCRLGVRDEILLLGPDTSTGGHPYHISQMLKKHGPILDIIGDHDYSAFRGKAMFRSVAAYDRLMRETEKFYGRRVPFVISEFGNYGRGAGAVNDDNRVYSGALSTTAYLIRMINHGAAGLARWEFLIYGNNWRNFGALTNADQDYIFRPYGPVFYPHAITARYVMPGWHVRKVQIDGASNTLWIAALTSPRGDITIILLNDDIKPVSLQFTFEFQPRPGQLHFLTVTGPLPEGIMEVNDIQLDQDKFKIMLPSKSIAALTSLPPGNLKLPDKLALKRTLDDEINLLTKRLNTKLRRMRKRAGTLKRYLRGE